MTRECWLVSDGNVLASAERAETHREKARGLLGRSATEGAMVLPHTAWVHTVGMRFDLDVAHLDRDGNVLRVTHMRRNRIGVPVQVNVIGTIIFLVAVGSVLVTTISSRRKR